MSRVDQDEIDGFIESFGVDLKFKVKDEVYSIMPKSTSFVSYDYICLNNKKYGFLVPEWNKTRSNENPNLSDAQIYLNKIKKICSTKFEDLSNKDFIILGKGKIQEELLEITFKDKLTIDRRPEMFEIKLYTNKDSDGASRIFGFIRHLNTLYIVLYDPYHEIFNKTGRIQ